MAEGAEDAYGVGDVRPGMAGRPHKLASQLENLGGVDTVSLVRELELLNASRSTVEPNGLEISRTL